LRREIIIKEDFIQNYQEKFKSLEKDNDIIILSNNKLLLEQDYYKNKINESNNNNLD